MESQGADSASMAEVLQALKTIQQSQAQTQAGLASVTQRLDQLAPEQAGSKGSITGASQSPASGPGLVASPIPTSASPSSVPSADRENAATQAQKSGFTSKIILT
jgi:hypothetical protein